MSKTKAWLFLMIAIITEVIGTLWLKASDASMGGYIAMGIFITSSYYFMGLSIRTIPIGIAYAMWEVVGMIAISSFSIVFFDELLNFYQKLGIILGIIGIILINMGEKK